MGVLLLLGGCVHAQERLPTASAAPGADLGRQTEDVDQPQPLDLPSGVSILFDCGVAGTAGTRFAGPETMELLFAGKRHVLARERTASGAKYSAGGVSFWNKGSEAMIEAGGRKFACTRERPATTPATPANPAPAGP